MSRLPDPPLPLHRPPRPAVTSATELWKALYRPRSSRSRRFNNCASGQPHSLDCRESDSSLHLLQLFPSFRILLRSPFCLIILDNTPVSRHHLPPCPLSFPPFLPPSRFRKLNDNSLEGSLLASIGNLTQLTLLSLGRNELSGPIPPPLSNLQALKYLLLSDNELSETIPAELGSITTLEALDLSMNRLSGSLPPSLLDLPALVY
ncbi:unnamed protein product, partial [Closterium sp. NIES-54]